MGAVKDSEKTGGRWSNEEAKYHINCLELMASFFKLKAFCKHEHGIHVQMYSDNSTTVTYIDAMGAHIPENVTLLLKISGSGT